MLGCAENAGMVSPEMTGGRRMRKKSHKNSRKNSRKKRGRRGGSMIADAAPVLSLLALNQYLHKKMGRKTKTQKRKSFRRKSYRR